MSEETSMPAAANTATPTKKVGRPRKVTGHKEPAPPTPAADDAAVVAPMTIDGLEIIESHRPQNLPTAPFNYVRLTLSDGSYRYQCIDCPETIGSRDEIRTHRKIVHPVVTNPNRLPAAVLAMSVGQLLATAESNLSIGALVERIEAERDRYRTELTELTRKYNALTRALEKVGFTLKLEDE